MIPSLWLYTLARCSGCAPPSFHPILFSISIFDHRCCRWNGYGDRRRTVALSRPLLLREQYFHVLARLFSHDNPWVDLHALSRQIAILESSFGSQPCCEWSTYQLISCLCFFHLPGWVHAGQICDSHWSAPRAFNTLCEYVSRLWWRDEALTRRTDSLRHSYCPIDIQYLQPIGPYYSYL